VHLLQAHCARGLQYLKLAYLDQSWSERGIVNPEVVGSFPSKPQKKPRIQIYMFLSYLDPGPEGRVLNYCFE